MSDLAQPQLMASVALLSSNGQINGNDQAHQIEESPPQASSQAKHFIPKPQTREQYQLLLLVCQFSFIFLTIFANSYLEMECSQSSRSHYTNSYRV